MGTKLKLDQKIEKTCGAIESHFLHNLVCMGLGMVGLLTNLLCIRFVLYQLERPLKLSSV